MMGKGTGGLGRGAASEFIGLRHSWIADSF